MPVPLLARAGIVAPFIETEVELATAVMVGLPPQVGVLLSSALKRIAERSAKKEKREKKEKHKKHRTSGKKEKVTREKDEKCAASRTRAARAAAQH